MAEYKAPTYTAEELALKIDHEGGIEEAIRYGIYPDQVPEHIRAQWAELVFHVYRIDDLKEELNLPDPSWY